MRCSSAAAAISRWCCEGIAAWIFLTAVGGLAPLRFPLVARRGQPTTGVKRGCSADVASMQWRSACNTAGDIALALSLSTPGGGTPRVRQ